MTGVGISTVRRGSELLSPDSCHLLTLRLRVTRPHRLGFPVLRWISMYRHAVVITPVARWVLIARGTAYSTRFPFIPSDGGLPHARARSATTLDVSRPAQRSHALRPVGLLRRLSDASVSKAPTVSFPPRVASIATGWSDPVAGWDLHPLKTNTFHTAHIKNVPFVRPGRPHQAAVLTTTG